MRDEIRSELHRVMDGVLPRGAGRVLLADCPNYSNVGDSAIMIGELDLLRSLRPGYRISVNDVDAYASHHDSNLSQFDAVLLNGGGNFGDLWPRHQNFRLHLLERLKDRPVVQMPQSIHFDDNDELERAKRVIGACRSFTLLVRDFQSLSVAKREFDCETLLCPDVAFGVADFPDVAADHAVFGLLRTDKEKLAASEGLRAAVLAVTDDCLFEDWVAETPSPTARRLGQLNRLRARHAALMRPTSRLHRAVFERLARERLARGLRQIGRGRIVVTDRLHGHLLAAFLGREVVVMDSRGGKVANFIRAFSHRMPNVHLAADVGEAEALLGGLLNAKT